MKILIRVLEVLVLLVFGYCLYLLFSENQAIKQRLEEKPTQAAASLSSVNLEDEIQFLKDRIKNLENKNIQLPELTAQQIEKIIDLERRMIEIEKCFEL